MTIGQGEVKGPRSFDPEAVEEVDLGRYLRLLGAHWWVVVAGLVFGAIAGFAIAVGHGQTYVATATLYLGQPYGGSGEIALQDLQTNPSTLDQIVHSFALDERVARACKARPGSFDHGISTLQVAGSSLPNHQNAHVTLSVLARQPKLDQCAANGLARTAVALLGSYADLKIAGDRAQIATDDRLIKTMRLGGTLYSASDKLLLLVQLRSLESDRATAGQLLAQTAKVENPRVEGVAHAERVTARTTRSSTLVATLIGGILGVIAVLGWDARVRRRSQA